MVFIYDYMFSIMITMIKKIYFVIILLLLVRAFPLFGLASNNNHIVINEIYVDAVNESGGEYIKLYNPLDISTDISGWRIKTDASDKDALLPPGAIIAPKSFYLIADTGWTEKKDNPNWPQADYEETISLYNADAGISLIDNNGRIIDAVGYGKLENIKGGYEGTPLDNFLVTNNQIVKRKIDGFDTDNNSYDFVVLGQINNNEGLEDNATSDIDGVIINELMPNPASPLLDILDEWIELYNDNDYRVDLSGARLRDSSSSAGYIIPEGTFIEPKRYAIFYSSATKIQLNNSGDFVELLDKKQALIDRTPNYGKAKGGISFALFSDGWAWTKEPTPLGKNVFEDVSYEDRETGISNFSKSKNSKKEPKNKSNSKNKNNDKNNKKIKGAKTISKENPGTGETKSFVSPIDNRRAGIILISLAAILSILYIIFRKRIYEYFKQGN